MNQRVKITVTMGCGHTQTYLDRIEDKYPFYCETCELDHRTAKYPWVITTEIVPA